MLFACLCAYAMACGLFVYRCLWSVLCVLLCHVLVVFFCSWGVCLWCVVLLCVVSLVCRACMVCSCCLVFVLVFWYGVNALPVCDCMLYVPYLRCYFLFV